MGYMTYYELEVVSNSESQAILSAFREQNIDVEYALTPWGESRQSCKWYTHQEDLKEFSKKYPDVLFVLSGEGEENKDIWQLYVKNGKSKKVMAVITFPEVAINKL